MKNILIVSVMLGLASVAAAQTDSSSSSSSSTQQSSSTTDQSTTTDQSGSTTTDQSGSTTDQSGSSTTDQSGSTTTDQSSTSTTTQSTTTTTTGANTSTGLNMTAVEQLPADQAFARAQELAAQAEIAYPVAFVDRVLWNQALSYANMAHMGDMQNRQYTAYLAQLYTRTQWWVNAYNTYQQLGTLNDQERDLAALSAAKLAYIALQRGDRTAARTYVTTGLGWRSTASLQALQRRL
jgi:hypothetical protein